MNTRAYFEDIQHYIIQELNKAQSSVYIAVAWFTDTKLFDLLCKKSKQGVHIQLILMSDDINNSCGINYNLLSKSGGKVWKVESDENPLMHNKFCVIDKQIIINGSYNWTNKAKQNHEIITVIEGQELASQFIEEFLFLRMKYFSNSREVSILDYGQICIRLDTLKNVILLNDKEDVDYQLQKIKKLIISSTDNSASAIWDIIKNTEERNYSAAVAEINNFVAKFHKLATYIDSEIAAMCLEKKSLGIQVSSLEDEKNDIERLLFAFNNRYIIDLGDLMHKILFIRKENLKEEANTDNTKTKDAKDAEADYENFDQSYEESKDEYVNEITEKQQVELKQKYRKASKLCHPDVVSEMQREHAKVTFHALKNAYDKNDLQTVSQILSELEKNIFSNKAHEINEKQELEASIKRLRISRGKLEQELIKLKQSEVYKLIVKIPDWDNYFSEKKMRLQEELKSLEKIR